VYNGRNHRPIRTPRNLQAYDDDFKRYFKVAGEFDSLIGRSPENLMKYASFMVQAIQAGKFTIPPSQPSTNVLR